MKILFPKNIMLCSLFMLASCSHVSPRTETGQMTQSQSFAPNMVSSGYEASSSGHRVKYNVPSAPATTPLCGSALQEQAQTGQKLYSQSLISGNNCALNACFQPLTGTYIAQTGNPVVCR